MQTNPSTTNEVLEFWGRNCLLELSSSELKIYVGKEAANPLLKYVVEMPLVLSFSSLKELREPKKVIPIRDIKRVERTSSSTVEIYWQEPVDNVIYRTVRESFELHEEEAERFYNAIVDLLRGAPFSQILKRYKQQAKILGEVIKDSERVIIIRDRDQKIAILNPEAFDKLYEGKKTGYKIDIFYCPDRVFSISKVDLSLLDVYTISFQNLAKVELKGQDRKGRYCIKIYLTNGVKLTVKLREYKNALRLYRRLQEILIKLGPRRIKSKPIIKILTASALVFVVTYWVTSSLFNLSQSAIPLAAFIAIIAFLILWILT